MTSNSLRLPIIYVSVCGNGDMR